jgi:transcriptional regulator of NAD metabolism
MLAEASATEISRQKQPEGFDESRAIARQGGAIMGNTRKEIEEKTGKPVVTRQNAKRLK